jgi:uncharacterized protein
LQICSLLIILLGMIDREAHRTLKMLAQHYPVLVVTGPRQSGKTTLVRRTFPDKPYISLEDPDVRDAALADPRGLLSRLPHGAVLDEAQRAPELFSYLQTQVDQDRVPGKWVVTGSQHLGLMAAVTQSLAGRAGLLHLLPLTLAEITSNGPPPQLEALLWRGQYPALWASDMPPALWMADYVATYVERDLRQLVNVRDLSAFQRFLRMCAARTAQTLNLSALGADCGITVNTAKAWLSALEASYIVFTLPAWHANLGQRLVKSPKLYFYDTGLAAWLCGLQDPQALAMASLRGPLFETWAVGEFVKARSNLRLAPLLHHFRNANGLEVDLVVESAGGGLAGVEFKSGQTLAGDWTQPLHRFASLTSAASLAVIHGGALQTRRDGVDMVPWLDLPRWAHECLGAG